MRKYTWSHIKVGTHRLISQNVGLRDSAAHSMLGLDKQSNVNTSILDIVLQFSTTAHRPTPVSTHYRSIKTSCGTVYHYPIFGLSHIWIPSSHWPVSNRTLTSSLAYCWPEERILYKTI